MPLSTSFFCFETKLNAFSTLKSPIILYTTALVCTYLYVDINCCINNATIHRSNEDRLTGRLFDLPGKGKIEEIFVGGLGAGRNGNMLDEFVGGLRGRVLKELSGGVI